MAESNSAGIMTGVELFSGAGGMSLGLESAGIRICAAVENDQDCAATYANAFPEVDLKVMDVREADFKAFKGIDLIAGGPPCQPFSTGGKRQAEADSRDMIPEFIRAVREARPAAVLMENVPGLLAPRAEDYLRGVVEELNGLGYSTYHRILNAADYGVPQNRRRFFLVGLLRGEFRFPRASHGPDAAKPYVPSGTILDPERPQGTAPPSKVVYAKKPDLRPNPYHGQLFNGGGRPIDLSAPCHTILASAGGNKTHFIDCHDLVPEYHHHLQSGGAPLTGFLPGARRLSVEESALIQGMPLDRFAFHGSRSSRYSQVGNAVPPELARLLGARLLAALRSTSTAPFAKVIPAEQPCAL